MLAILGFVYSCRQTGQLLKSLYSSSQRSLPESNKDAESQQVNENTVRSNSVSLSVFGSDLPT